MKKVVLSIVAVAACGLPVFAADLGKTQRVAAAPPPPAAVSPWDIAFGAAVMSDYNFRGISQSDRDPSVNAYFEPRFNLTPNWQLYAGISASSVELPTDPGAEIDYYAGIRPTFGPIAHDIGFMYYYYPSERAIDGIVITAPPAFNTSLNDTDYWEVYWKSTWTLNENWALGSNTYYSPSWLNTGAYGWYSALTAKFTAPSTMFQPDWGGYISGELGSYRFGTTDFVPGVFVDLAGTGGIELPDYLYWNIGAGLTYKMFTLDLRYHDTDLSKAECNALTGDPGAAAITPVPINNFATAGASRWCGSAFIVKLGFDTTLSAMYK